MNTKKKIRKSISWLVVLTIFLSAFPHTVFANENKVESKVNVFVQVGQGEQQEITIPEGKITDHLDDVEKLIPKAKKSAFEKVVAVVLEQGGVTTEIEISAVERTAENDIVYYTLDDYDGSSGIVLEKGQKIVLYYEMTYTLQYICDGLEGGGGNVGQSPKTVTAGEDLHVSLLPDDNCFPVSAKMVRNDTTFVDYSSSISGHQLVIPAADITQDAVIYVTFKKYKSYQVNAGNIANGIFCINCIKNASDSHASSDNNYQGVTVDNGANSAVVQTGKSVLIPLYSNRTNSSGSQSWELNRLKINNEDVKVPGNLDVDIPYETTLSNGTKVKVVYKGAERCNTGSCQHDAARNRTRNIYYIYIDNVKTNNSIEANFKDTSRQEIIFKGLEGIESTGNALETRNYQASIPSGYHYYYTLYEDFTNNVYMYNDTAAVHVNMYVYKVKPGYNPYTVNVQGINTGKMNGEDDITKPGGNMVNLGYTIEEMAALAKSESRFRHLDGTTGTNLNWRDLGGRDNAFVPKSLSRGYEFGFFLSDPEGKISNNQMVYLNASKYDYAVTYDVNGGSGHVEDSNRYQIGQQFNIASSSPTRNGYIFQGWQLVDSNGNVVNNTVYKRNQAFDVNDTTVEYTYGDKTENNGLGFTFKAVWKQMSENADLNEYTIHYYREVKTQEVDSIEKDGKYYVEYYKTSTFLGLIGAEIIAINDRTLDASTINWNRYVFNQNISRLYISKLQGTEDINWQEHNKLYYFFDLIEIGSLTIENQVTGTYANVNKAFEYTVTINDPTAGDGEFDIAGSSGNPTSIKNNVATTLYLKNDEYIFIDGLSKETTYVIEENNDGYKVSISLTYSVAQGSVVTYDENSITGSMSLEEEIQDINIVFTNHLDYEELPTGIQLNGFPYIISLIIISSTSILFIRNKRKKQV